MIEIRRSRRKVSTTPLTIAGAGSGYRGDPSGPMFPSDMDQQIRLYPTRVIAAGTCPDRCISLLRVCLEPVLIEATLLDKCLVTIRAGVLLHAFMTLNMIEHCILSRLRLAAMRAYELPALVLQILGLSLRVHTLTLARPHPVQLLAGTPGLRHILIAVKSIR